MKPVTVVSIISMLSGAALILRIFWKNHKRSKDLMKILPSAPRHWLYGSLKDIIDGTPMTTFMLRLSARYQHGYINWIGYFMPFAHLNHPDLIKPALKRTDGKGPAYHHSLKPWLGEGLLISSGERWFRSRRLLTPAFHFDVLKPYINIYNDAVEVLMSMPRVSCMLRPFDPWEQDDLVAGMEEGILTMGHRIGRSLHQIKEMEKIETAEMEKNGHKFALFNNVCNMSLDIILQCAFSFESDCQKEEKGHPYVHAVFDLAKLIQIRLQSVLFNLIPFLYWLTPNGRKFQSLCDLVHREATDVINRRIAQLEESGGQLLEDKKYLDFLDILLTSRDEQGKSMEPSDIRAEVDTFLFEGHDTTASGTSWALYCLATHPECQAKVYGELDDLLADRTSDRIEWGDIGKIPYTSLCLKEAMRLYPPVPMIGRVLSSDLEVDGHMISKGTRVIINIIGCHHNPSVWGDDYMEYKPERFLHENAKDRDPYAFISFSAGPRNCIGQHFALNEMKVVLCRLLQRYHFEVADDSPSAQTEIRIVLRSKEEVYLRAIPRL